MKKLKRPWINKKLESLILKKHSIYSKCVRKLLPFSRFKNYRNLLNKTLNLAKKIYYEEQFSVVNNNSKKTWEIINKVTNPCKVKNIVITENNILLDNENVLAHNFNLYFPASTPPCNINQNPVYHMPMHSNSFFVNLFILKKFSIHFAN